MVNGRRRITGSLPSSPVKGVLAGVAGSGEDAGEQTMFVIEAERSDVRPRIAGVFGDRTVAEAFFHAAHAEPNAKLSLYEIPANYPVYLIEDDGFRFVDLDGIRSAMDGFLADGVDDESCPTIYCIEEDFQGERPGQDWMGALYHIHVDHDFLLRYDEWPQDVDPFHPPPTEERLEIERVAMLIAAALQRAGLVSPENVERAVEITSNVIELRNLMELETE
jgi:hypothetical protein